MSISPAERIGTYADLVADYGDPSQGGGGPEAVARAKHLRNLHQKRLEDVLAGVQRRGDSTLNASEQRASDAHLSEIGLLDSAIAVWGSRVQREAEVHKELGLVGTVGEQRTQRFHTSGGTTYRKGDPHGPSWVADMAHFALRQDPDAGERLRRNDREVATETRALSTTDGSGGDFVPPLYVINDYIELARASRVTANLVRREPLPAGTDSVNVPIVATGTAVAEQAVQNTAIQQTDLTTSSVTGNVATLAGGQTVALQLIEQSPINVDQMILGDLLADLASKVDLFVLNNTGTNKKGLLQVTGTNAVTYTDATPTVPEFYSKLADAVRQVQVGRFQSPTAIIMSPMRWAWMLAASDSQGRPLVTPDAGGPQNSLGQTSGLTDVATGRVGVLMGLPVFVDPLMPSNLGAGTNEDRVIVGRMEDAVLYESAPRAEAFRDTKADSLAVFIRTYEYLAFVTRYPKSFSVVAGTGLVQPTL